MADTSPWDNKEGGAHGDILGTVLVVESDCVLIGFKGRSFSFD